MISSFARNFSEVRSLDFATVPRMLCATGYPVPVLATFLKPFLKGKILRSGE